MPPLAVTLLLALVLPLAWGCGGRAKRPVRVLAMAADAPTATVWNTRSGNSTTYLVSVDGKRVPYPRVLFFNDTTQPVVVPAGVRQVEVTIDSGNHLTGWTFNYPFEAGHAYLMQRAYGQQDRVEVYDETTRTAVVIRKPPRRPPPPQTIPTVTGR